MVARVFIVVIALRGRAGTLVRPPAARRHPRRADPHHARRRSVRRRCSAASTPGFSARRSPRTRGSRTARRSSASTRATPEERREKLMPFFWKELMAKHGSIAGNRALGSSVSLTNTHRFSYPGYSEILTGEAHDDVIKSNDRVQNPYRTVLEELKERLSLPAAGVAAFGSWEVFNEISEHTPGNLTINAGYEPFETRDPAASELSRMQFQTPTAWDSARYDAYTFYLAMAPSPSRAAARPLPRLRRDRRLGARRPVRSRARRALTHRRLSEGAVDVAAVAAGVSADAHPDHHRSRPRPHDGGLEDARRENRGGAGNLDGVHQPGDDAARRMAQPAGAPHQSGGRDDRAWMGVDWTAGRPGVGQAIR